MTCRKCRREIAATPYGYGTAQPGLGCYHRPAPVTGTGSEGTQVPTTPMRGDTPTRQATKGGDVAGGIPFRAPVASLGRLNSRSRST